MTVPFSKFANNIKYFLWLSRQTLFGQFLKFAVTKPSSVNKINGLLQKKKNLKIFSTKR